MKRSSNTLEQHEGVVRGGKTLRYSEVEDPF